MKAHSAGFVMKSLGARADQFARQGASVLAGFREI